MQAPCDPDSSRNAQAWDAIAKEWSAHVERARVSDQCLTEMKQAEKIMHDAIYSLDRMSAKDGDVLIVIHRFGEFYAAVTGILATVKNTDIPELDMGYMSKFVAENPLMKSSFDEMKRGEAMLRSALNRPSSLDDAEGVSILAYRMVSSLYQMNLMMKFNAYQFRQRLEKPDGDGGMQDDSCMCYSPHCDDGYWSP